VLKKNSFFNLTKLKNQNIIKQASQIGNDNKPTTEIIKKPYRESENAQFDEWN